MYNAVKNYSSSSNDLWKNIYSFMAESLQLVSLRFISPKTTF